GGDRAVRAGRPQLQQRRRGGGRAAGRRPLPHHHGIFNSTVENLKRRKTGKPRGMLPRGFSVRLCRKTKRPRPVAAPGGGIWGISFGVRRNHVPGIGCGSVPVLIQYPITAKKL